MKRLVVFCVTVALASTSPLFADRLPCAAGLGTFISGDYQAGTLGLSVGENDFLYIEDELETPYELVIWSHKLEKGLTSVVRFDDYHPRAGISFDVGGWKARILGGDGPERIDVWSPCPCLWKCEGASLSLLGWFKAQTGSEPDIFAGPRYQGDGFVVEYGVNLRTEGDDYFYASIDVLQFGLDL